MRSHSLRRAGSATGLAKKQQLAWEFACAKFEAGSQSEHENICKHRAGAHILRVGICSRPEQERCCTIDTAGSLSTGGKDLLREDHRFWHSDPMHKVGRAFPDHQQQHGDYRARAVQIRILPKNRG